MALGVGDQALMEARLGSVARLAATRLAYYTFEVYVTVNAVVVPSLRGSTQVVDVLQKESTADVTVLTGTPLAGQPIEIGLGSVGKHIFSGFVSRVHLLKKPGPDGSATVQYRLECVDNTYLLNQRLVWGKWPNANDGDMLKTILTEFAPEFGLSEIETGSSIPQQSFKHANMGSVISKLARQGGATFFVRPNLSVVYWHTGAPPSSQVPADIDASNLTYDRIVWRPGSISQVKTRIIVEGMNTSLSASVDPGDTTAAVEELEAYNASGGLVVLGTEEVTYGGVSAASGPGNLTGIPASGDGSIAFYWGAGTDVSILVKVDDGAAQTALAARTGRTGVREFKVVDHRLSETGATNRGNAELAKYSTIQDAANLFGSRDRFMTVGNLVTVNLPGIGASGTLVIQKVVTRSLAPTRIERDVEFGPFREDFLDMMTEQLRPAGEV